MSLTPSWTDDTEMSIAEILAEHIEATADFILYVKHVSQSHTAYSRVFYVSRDILSIGDNVRKHNFQDALSQTNGVVSILNTLILSTKVSTNAKLFIRAFLQQFQTIVKLIKELNK